MYISDFFKRMTRRTNIPVLIYLIINVFVIAGIIYILADVLFWQAIVTGLVLYFISVVIALSDIGEWILRKKAGCVKITREDQIVFIEPIFNEVFQKAKLLDPALPDDIELFVNDDEAPNAFATGRKTICLTAGMFNMPVEQIKATLAHELGHISHKDTDLFLIVTVGNFIVTGMIFLIKIIVEAIHIITAVIGFILGGKEGIITLMFNGLYHLLMLVFVTGLTKLWTGIGTLLVMNSSRKNEYKADEFAFNLGYGNDLCMMLDTIDSSDAEGLFATLASSHPNTDKRIAKLQELGADYNSEYSVY